MNGRVSLRVSERSQIGGQDCVVFHLDVDGEIIGSSNIVSADQFKLLEEALAPPPVTEVSTLRVAMNAKGTWVAIRRRGTDHWRIGCPHEWQGATQTLPDDWTEYRPATERDLLAEELRRVGDQMMSGVVNLRRIREAVQQQDGEGTA